MSKRILIENGPEGREIALMEDRSLLHFSREMPAGIEAEQIYLGAVDRIVKGMEACFVKLGREAMGFLPFSECREKPRSGDKILVQVKKPPVGEKAAYLTEDISLAGRLTVLTPLTARTAVSSRLEDESVHARLHDLGRRLCPAGMGIVLRTESADAEEDDIRSEIGTLTAEWENVLAHSRTESAPCLLKGREDALLRLLRDEKGGVDEILADDPDALPAVPVPVRACMRPFELYGVRDKLRKSLQRKVWLDCGGYLVIDLTEAMTVIDVNSGKFTGGKAGAESAFLKLNLEAAREIARLLRLRNLGGIIIIDFVDMRSEESRQAVSDALRAALFSDPVKTVLHGFTALGLMEMTRKKN